MIKKIVLGLAAIAAISAAVPASAQVVIRENRRGDVVVRPAGAYVDHRFDRRDRFDRFERRHHRHRVVYFDRFGHRHVTWR